MPCLFTLPVKRKMISTWLLCAAITAFLLYILCTNTKESLTDKDVPAYSKSLPFIGITHLLLTDTIKFWEVIRLMFEETSRRGGIIKTEIALLKHYIITDPEDAETVANNCLDKHFVYKFTEGVVGKSLLAAPVSMWKIHRKLLNPAFNLLMIHGFIDCFNEHAKKLTEQLSVFNGKGPFIPTQFIYDSVLRTVFPTKVALHCLMESNNPKMVITIAYRQQCFFMPHSIKQKRNVFNSYVTTVGNSYKDNDTIIENYGNALNRLTSIYTQRLQKVWQLNDFIFKLCGQKEKQDKAIKIIRDISDMIIHKATKRKKGHPCNNSDGRREGAKTFLDKYLELNANNTLTDEEFRQELYLIIAAAFDSTSIILQYLLCLVGSHTEIQERIFKEVISVIGKDKSINKEDLQKLVYTDAVLKETLRLYPSAPIAARSINQNLKLKNCTLPRGSHAVISLYGINRHPSWGPDADDFRPERWLEPGAVKIPTTFATFSIGKRNCLGQTYAMMNLKINLAHLVRRYHIQADYTKMQLKFDVLLMPAKGHEISLKLRNTD